jgi:HTH-type transcriptional regulator, sugar sensing transcriptional regulator
LSNNYSRTDRMTNTTALLQLGFTEYESRAYIVLLQRNPLNGYEVAKASGLPRANVYAVLQKLEERGAVVRLDTPGGTRYAPVPPGELTQRMERDFQEALDQARILLAEVATPPEREFVWNLQGYSTLLEQARTLLDSTHGRLLMAVWPQEALALAESVAHAEARGVDVTTLCLAACPDECGACRGHVYRYSVALAQESRWLLLIPDGSQVLAGEIGPGETASAIRTQQRLLVELTQRYIRHSIALAALLNDLGRRLEDALQPETLAALEALSAGGPESDWLGQLRQFLNRQGAGPSLPNASGAGSQ